MNKVLIACTVIVALGGNFSSALADTTASATYGQPVVQSSTVSATELPYTVAHLKGQVQTLENEVQALRVESQSVQEETVRDFDEIPMGG
ncbi:MAG: hypothetical protein P4L54_10895 [Acidocella sp.]|nr:hypothetical protein [Acidocella sp.]